MQNHSDDDLDFDDDFLSDDLDDDVALEDFDDDFLGDEEWDSTGLDQGEQAPEAAPQGAASNFKQPKKFSLSFNTIVIGGAVILGIVVLSFQLMKGQKQVSQGTRFISSLGLEGTAENISGEREEETSDASDNVNEDAERSGGFLTDETNTLPGELYLDEQKPIELPMPTPVSEEEEGRPSVADSLQFLTETRDPTLIEPQDQEKPIDTVPRGPEIKDDPVIVPKVTVPEDDEFLEIESDTEEEVDEVKAPSASLDGINEKMDLFLDRMDGLENKINEIDDAQNERSRALEKSVEALQLRVSSASKPSVAKTRTVKKSEPAAVKRKIQWQLKAAQPGKAWISQKGQNAIKAVRVGDKVDGVGKIQDIRLTSGRWVVVGSEGTIRQ